MSHELFANRNDRVLSAKRRYFEEGILPTGIVSDEILKSWARCNLNQQRPLDTIEFQPTAVSQNQYTVHKNRVLFAAWLKELPAITKALGSANCSAILLDESGVLIDTSPLEAKHLKIIPVAHRAGVQLSEDSVGTCAPGIVLRTGKQSCVLGKEHYFESVGSMYCAAAPILNIHGQLAGVLNISSEGKPFYFDPTAVISMYAASIENRLLLAQSQEHLVVKFQFLPAIIDTPMVGLLGFDLSGRLAWSNSVAKGLLGVRNNHSSSLPRCVEDVFDSSFSALASLAGNGVVTRHLRNGLQIFIACELHTKNSFSKKIIANLPVNDEAFLARDRTLEQPHPTSRKEQLLAQTSQLDISLKQVDAHLIQQHLVQYKGNITKVAKQLKVSRGLIYRRLQATELTQLPVKQ
jgi:sigma-54 dependent transcriptional regulator, acetoin dehydrogenase operon transcriptional activator AcoR